MKKKIAISTLLLVFIAIIGIFFSYNLLFKDNIIDNKSGKKEQIIFIHTGATYNDVLYELKNEKIIKNITTFKIVAEKLGYANKIKPGRYEIGNNSGNLFIVQKLRSGRQDPVRITFNNIQDKAHLAKIISTKIEASQSSLLQAFNNPNLLDSLHLTEDNFPTIFLANTYEFYWNTSAQEFINRMLKEYDKFWNSSRRSKAEKLGLSPTEITILASIIQKESNKYDEYPIIAGVYLNRIKIGMPLQADPTVLYALKRLGVSRRVLHIDLKIQSPYNTYIHKGLPPGPICLPELKSIDETLDAEEHDYLYFCAKEDFSGYSNFAATWQEHQANARKYQQALNERNIRH
ncbi:MAG: endolytic transglycosylase MltG [Chitinophagales bacterium]|nr:endolytic transglycosylase MltG [Bacteroidota bacterium]